MTAENPSGAESDFYEGLEDDHHHDEGLAIPTVLKVIILVAVSLGAILLGLSLRG